MPGKDEFAEATGAEDALLEGFDQRKTDAARSGVAAVRLAGGNERPYPLVIKDGRWQIDVAALEAALTPRTTAIVLNSPHNPTGWTATADDCARIAAFATAHNLWVISDEIYSGLAYDYADGQSPSMGRARKSRTRSSISAHRRLTWLRLMPSMPRISPDI